MPSWWRIEALRSKAALLFLIATLAIVQPSLPLANADRVTTEVTLYAHTDPTATSVGGRVLSLSPNATSRQSADVRPGLAFTLPSPLSASLRVLGTVDVYVWLVSSQSARGTLRVTISEVTANASVTNIISASVTAAVSSIPYQVIFGQGPANYTVRQGSTLRLEIQFSTPASVPVMLLWDDPVTSTRLILRVESIPRIGLRIADMSGRESTIFPANETDMMASLRAEVTVEDPFRGTNIRAVSLSVTNSSGFYLMNNTAMNLISRSELPFRLNYSLPITIPLGQFNITVSVLDAVNRVFVSAREITVTRFYTLIVELADPQKRALPGLNVSVTALGQLIHTAMTDSSGTAIMQVPSSQAVGLHTLQVRKGGVTLLSREMDVESDSSALITVELYDWKIHVVTTFLTFNFPLPGATVDLRLNGTLFASNLTDTNGEARFTELPRGAYEIEVRSFLASNRFLNVTLLPEAREKVLSLPIGISESTAIILAVIAVVAVFGVIAARRRKLRTRHFKHVAELLGGVAPASSIIMIVGPSGSGKSLLLQNILADLLRLVRRCVYISNSELPSKIRERLGRMGVDVEKFQQNNRLRFIDAYSGAAGAVSHEKYSVASARDLTGLGIQMTSCLEELGEAGDVFLDSLTPVVASGGFERGFDFVEYYGSRTTKSGGAFLYVASTTIEPKLLTRLEEASDCVLETERSVGMGKIRGRLLVKKARGLEHEPEWVGIKIASSGRMEFMSLPSEKA